jgi:predicted phosphodiesterase
MLIGIIYDTHGLLRPEALNALASVEHIIHAGDIGSPDIVPSHPSAATSTLRHGLVTSRGSTRGAKTAGSSRSTVQKSALSGVPVA